MISGSGTTSQRDKLKERLNGANRFALADKKRNELLKYSVDEYLKGPLVTGETKLNNLREKVKLAKTKHLQTDLRFDALQIKLSSRYNLNAGSNFQLERMAVAKYNKPLSELTPDELAELQKGLRTAKEKLKYERLKYVKDSEFANKLGVAFTKDSAYGLLHTVFHSKTYTLPEKLALIINISLSEPESKVGLKSLTNAWTALSGAFKKIIITSFLGFTLWETMSVAVASYSFFAAGGDPKGVLEYLAELFGSQILTSGVERLVSFMSNPMVYGSMGLRLGVSLLRRNETIDKIYTTKIIKIPPQWKTTLRKYNISPEIFEQQLGDFIMTAANGYISYANGTILLTIGGQLLTVALPNAFTACKNLINAKVSGTTDAYITFFDQASKSLPSSSATYLSKNPLTGEDIEPGQPYQNPFDIKSKTGFNDPEAVGMGFKVMEEKSRLSEIKELLFLPDKITKFVWPEGKFRTEKTTREKEIETAKSQLRAKVIYKPNSQKESDVQAAINALVLNFSTAGVGLGLLGIQIASALVTDTAPIDLQIMTIQSLISTIGVNNWITKITKEFGEGIIPNKVKNWFKQWENTSIQLKENPNDPYLKQVLSALTIELWAYVSGNVFISNSKLKTLEKADSDKVLDILKSRGFNVKEFEGKKLSKEQIRALITEVKNQNDKATKVTLSHFAEIMTSQFLLSSVSRVTSNQISKTVNSIYVKAALFAVSTNDNKLIDEMSAHSNNFMWFLRKFNVDALTMTDIKVSDLTIEQKGNFLFLINKIMKKDSIKILENMGIDVSGLKASGIKKIIESKPAMTKENKATILFLQTSPDTKRLIFNQWVQAMMEKIPSVVDIADPSFIKVIAKLREIREKPDVYFNYFASDGANEKFGLFSFTQIVASRVNSKGELKKIDFDYGQLFAPSDAEPEIVSIDSSAILDRNISPELLRDLSIVPLALQLEKYALKAGVEAIADAALSIYTNPILIVHQSIEKIASVLDVASVGTVITNKAAQAYSIVSILKQAIDAKKPITKENLEEFKKIMENNNPFFTSIAQGLAAKGINGNIIERIGVYWQDVIKIYDNLSDKLKVDFVNDITESLVQTEEIAMSDIILNNLVSYQRRGNEAVIKGIARTILGNDSTTISVFESVYGPILGFSIKDEPVNWPNLTFEILNEQFEKFNADLQELYVKNPIDLADQKVNFDRRYANLRLKNYAMLSLSVSLMDDSTKYTDTPISGIQDAEVLLRGLERNVEDLIAESITKNIPFQTLFEKKYPQLKTLEIPAPNIALKGESLITKSVYQNLDDIDLKKRIQSLKENGLSEALKEFGLKNDEKLTKFFDLNDYTVGGLGNQVELIEEILKRKLKRNPDFDFSDAFEIQSLGGLFATKIEFRPPNVDADVWDIAYFFKQKIQLGIITSDDVKETHPNVAKFLKAGEAKVTLIEPDQALEISNQFNFFNKHILNSFEKTLSNDPFSIASQNINQIITQQLKNPKSLYNSGLFTSDGFLSIQPIIDKDGQKRVICSRYDENALIYDAKTGSISEKSNPIVFLPGIGRIAEQYYIKEIQNDPELEKKVLFWGQPPSLSYETEVMKEKDPLQFLKSKGRLLKRNFAKLPDVANFMAIKLQLKQISHTTIPRTKLDKDEIGDLSTSDFKDLTSYKVFIVDKDPAQLKKEIDFSAPGIKSIIDPFTYIDADEKDYKEKGLIVTAIQRLLGGIDAEEAAKYLPKENKSSLEKLQDFKTSNPDFIDKFEKLQKDKNLNEYQLADVIRNSVKDYLLKNAAKGKQVDTSKDKVYAGIIWAQAVLITENLRREMYLDKLKRDRNDATRVLVNLYLKKEPFELASNLVGIRNNLDRLPYYALEQGIVGDNLNLGATNDIAFVLEAVLSHPDPFFTYPGFDSIVKQLYMNGVLIPGTFNAENFPNLTQFVLNNEDNWSTQIGLPVEASQIVKSEYRELYAQKIRNIASQVQENKSAEKWLRAWAQSNEASFNLATLDLGFKFYSLFYDLSKKNVNINEKYGLKFVRLSEMEGLSDTVKEIYGLNEPSFNKWLISLLG